MSDKIFLLGNKFQAALCPLLSKRKWMSKLSLTLLLQIALFQMKEEVIAEVGVSSLSLTFSIFLKVFFLPGFLGPLKKLSIKFDKKNRWPRYSQMLLPDLDSKITFKPHRNFLSWVPKFVIVTVLWEDKLLGSLTVLVLLI